MLKILILQRLYNNPMSKFQVENAIIRRWKSNTVCAAEFARTDRLKDKLQGKDREKLSCERLKVEHGDSFSEGSNRSLNDYV